MITSRIEKLIRTNTALVLLCIISVGVLVLVWRDSAPASSGDVSPRISIEQSSQRQQAPDPEPEIAAAFRGMPEPASFNSFVYEGEETLSVSTKCSDEFSVIMIFPANIDYRVDVASARYNSAQQCVRGQVATERITASGFGFEVGQSYYIVKASQGRKGMWHDPY